MIFLEFTDAFFYWRKRVESGKETRKFGDWLDTLDKKTKHGYYGIKKE